MMNHARRAVRPRLFLFGMGRSGTSWASVLLADALDGHLIYEPYNWNLNPGGSPFKLRYVETEPPSWRFDEILRGRLRDLPRDGRPVVIKDVMTVLAMPYLQRRFGGSVVVLVRHPCAVAGSWHALGWDAAERIDLLLEQPELMSAYLVPYARHLREARDPWVGLGALWGALHHLMRQRFRADLGWKWISYEWLCEEPAAHVAQVARSAGFSLSPEAEARLWQAVRSHDRPLAADETPFETYRPTAVHRNRWRDAMTDDQQARVIAGVEPFGLLDSWSIPPVQLSWSRAEDR
jgi:hypothetical protein